MPFMEHYAADKCKQWVAALHLQLFINLNRKGGRNGFDLTRTIGDACTSDTAAVQLGYQSLLGFNSYC
jgi:hypothetical protein